MRPRGAAALCGVHSGAGSPAGGACRGSDRAPGRPSRAPPPARLVRAVQWHRPRRAPRDQVRRRAAAGRAPRGGDRSALGTGRRRCGPRHARPGPRRQGPDARLRPGRAHRPCRRAPPGAPVRPVARPRARHDRPVRPGSIRPGGQRGRRVRGSTVPHCRCHGRQPVDGSCSSTTSSRRAPRSRPAPRRWSEPGRSAPRPSRWPANDDRAHVSCADRRCRGQRCRRARRCRSRPRLYSMPDAQRGGAHADDRQGQECRGPGSGPRLHRAQAPPARPPPRRPDRRHRRVLQRDAQERVGRPHRRGHPRDRRAHAAQPRSRHQLPGCTR